MTELTELGIASGEPLASEWGPEDEHGATNRNSPESRAAIMARMDGRRVYDLSVDYFLGMPSFQAAGDPVYQIWMTHTPAGPSSTTSTE
jgi:hypothetical protein